jgi:hypothetical protein
MGEIETVPDAVSSPTFANVKLAKAARGKTLSAASIAPPKPPA